MSHLSHARNPILKLPILLLLYSTLILTCPRPRRTIGNSLDVRTLHFILKSLFDELIATLC